jgi:hypothetical protein
MNSQEKKLSKKKIIETKIKSLQTPLKYVKDDGFEKGGSVEGKENYEQGGGVELHKKLFYEIRGEFGNKNFQESDIEYYDGLSMANYVVSRVAEDRNVMDYDINEFELKNLKPGDKSAFYYIDSDHKENIGYVELMEKELDLLDSIYEELREEDVSVKKASTGTLYINISDFAGDENIRISDHDANTTNKRNNPNFEIDVNKITDIHDFALDVYFSLRNEELEGLEKYKYEY